MQMRPADRVGKLNELVLVLHVDENETASPFICGAVDISTTEVLRTRDCVLTNKEYPALSFRHSGIKLPARVKSNQDAQKCIFHNGPLVCRVVNVLYLSKSGKAYGGEVRRLTSREVDENHTVSPKLLSSGHCSETSIEIDDGDNSEEEFVVINNRKRREMPKKATRYTFGDVFCGAGGSSQGAKQAGLTVCWGLDHDDAAIEAYFENHPGALPFNCDAHEFPPKGATLKELKVDILHLSPPCCYWSPVQ
jgi:DNA (cytosine-5)-methyltransferase 1